MRKLLLLLTLNVWGVPMELLYPNGVDPDVVWGVPMEACITPYSESFYDDGSVRFHVRRVRDFLTLSSLYTSLSTLLVLQHEATEQKGADATRLEAPELDGLGLMEDVSGSMHNLIASSRKEIKCIESIVFSSFNPPPSYRRLVGDLIYLDVVTLEGNMFCITGTSKHFYVNSSTGDVLDPLPSEAGHEANTLVELLQNISSKFKKGFREILERKAAAHPFENVQPPLSQNSWLYLYPIPVAHISLPYHTSHSF